ncbi:sulfur carrier protein ThiS [Acinetobacter lwoffii]|jgi:sulfur carrier protein|uniref:Sulfur carrier protein n=1 Tax=Acinetobacter lwoffii TaxID=28090 RepID=A0AAW8L6G7_ACILW|nr:MULTISPECIES: sulfur carrier protein ThiS [Acinetobacter]MBB6362609.1 sulfur carrier protein [Acinetobacter lwoffii]MCO8073595.1 sulfur carrier protein ThiS [Acinetobacter lwoffii]MCO8076579.1 sulfur carrier protein ThiS [Acinetobacter lwoffii]MDR6628285.1 sulfur carrier protein [Acinetobacter lwoffii]MEB6678327.1 sulfur carrier protein ThiS [Acinetobacter lwoffii]
MMIYINGEQHETHCKNLLELIQSMALEGKRFAVEVNEMIIPKSRLGDTPICDTDKIEIIHAVGGG